MQGPYFTSEELLNVLLSRLTVRVIIAISHFFLSSDRIPKKRERFPKVFFSYIPQFGSSLGLSLCWPILNSLGHWWPIIIAPECSQKKDLKILISVRYVLTLQCGHHQQHCLKIFWPWLYIQKFGRIFCGYIPQTISGANDLQRYILKSN